MKPVVDLNENFFGGMDTSRPPSYLSENKYWLGVNTWIKNSPNGLSNRPSFREFILEFGTKEQEDIYRSGRIQAEGWFSTGEEVIQVRSVNGYVFHFKFRTTNRLFGYIVSASFPNNPKNHKAWITRIPFGAVVSDGESACILTTADGTRRTNPNNREIGAGCMAAYVQNRLFMADVERRRIMASDFGNPVSIQESLDNNLYGFIAPEEDDQITAIGQQKILNDFANSGNLSFSTRKNIYRVDVRSSMADWGKINGRYGYVVNAVPDVGAVSSYSYESVNSNLYFRNASFGLMNTKHSEQQFIQQDFYSQSLEASLFFENDTHEFLDSCYSRKYKNKVLTTTGPQLVNGGIIWNGVLVMSPDVFFSENQVISNIWDGVMTGIRPWCMTSIDHRLGQWMIFDSHDYDGVNRMYYLDESSSLDYRKDMGEQRFQSKVWTRGYTYKAIDKLKTETSTMYSIANLNNQETTITFQSRDAESGVFSNATKEHVFKSPHTRFSGSMERVNVQTSSKQGYLFQNLIKILGSFSLRRLIKRANQEEKAEEKVTESSIKQECTQLEEPVYTYKLHG